MRRQTALFAAACAVALAVPILHAAQVGVDNSYWGTSVGSITNIGTANAEVFTGTLSAAVINGWLADPTTNHGIALIPAATTYYGNSMMNTQSSGGQVPVISFTSSASTATNVPINASALISRTASTYNANGASVTWLNPINGGPHPLLWQWDLSSYSGTLSADATITAGAVWSEASKTFYLYEIPTAWDPATVTYGTLVVALQPLWDADIDGTWGNANNWQYNAVPGITDTEAILGSAITAPHTVTLDVSPTLSTLIFDNANTYTIAAGGGTLTLNGATVTVNQGQHIISAPVYLGGATINTVTADSSLTFTASFTNTNWNRAGLTKSGPGTLFLLGPTYHVGTLTLNGGATILGDGTNSTMLDTMLWTPSTINTWIGGYITGPGTLELKAHASVSLNPSTLTPATLAGSIGGLTIDDPTTSTFNLVNNSLVVESTPANLNTDFANVRALVLHGRNDGTTSLWSGGGITASAAAAAYTAYSGQEYTGLAVVKNADLPNQFSTANLFSGQTADANSILVKYTYVGDANLDGKLSLDDYLAIDSGYLLGGTGYNHGDFNYDGVVDAKDYALIDANFLAQGSPLAAEMIALHTSWFGSDYADLFSASAPLNAASVPEPASLALLTVAAAALFRRRKKT